MWPQIEVKKFGEGQVKAYTNPNLSPLIVRVFTIHKRKNNKMSRIININGLAQTTT